MSDPFQLDRTVAAVPGDQLRIAANHEAGIVSKAVTAPGYHDEVAGFFRTGKSARRPVPAPARVRS